MWWVQSCKVKEVVSWIWVEERTLWTQCIVKEKTKKQNYVEGTDTHTQMNKGIYNKQCS